MTGRLLALKVLCRWSGSGLPISGVFDSATAGADLGSKELQLARILVFGVLRQQQYLDFILKTFARHPLHKMKPQTLYSLRLGLFQLLLLDRIPESAAVNETVKAFKATRQPRWLVNFVNGVLRNAARDTSNLPGPNQATIEGQPILNHPDWLVNRWQHNFGREKAYAICRVNNETPSLTLRVNTRAIQRDQLLTLFARAELQVQAGRFSPESLQLPVSSGNVTALPGYKQGYFQVQDEAAQLVSHLLPLREGGEYLDGCAGLGGKTSHLGALVPETAQITAVEPDERRYQLLGENLDRLGIKQAFTINSTLEQFARETAKQFDAILLDAPCSGTGVIGRHPDIRWNRQPEDLPQYQKQQLCLLDTAASLLKREGVLVYATCSLEPEENAQVVTAFLAEHREYTLDMARNHLPASAVHLVNDQGFFHPTPADGLDGFFAARLRKKRLP